MLNDRYDFKDSEKKWQIYWQSNNVYSFDEKNGKIFSIDTPPPTVNGDIHIGHIFSYTQSEFIARYYRMKGYNVFYPFGFDDNGLPTERLVEKKFKIRAHEISREDFIAKCLSLTSDLEKKFKELFVSNGFSVDWSHEYSTISEKARKISQKSFIELFKNKKVYYSDAPALWCNECKTAIAQAELETKDLPSKFNYLKFFFKDSDEYIEIATTRPELLAACCCVFVHPDDSRYKSLVGKQVKVPLYDFFVTILADENVDKDKGTGVVMCCTFGDLRDLDWYKKYNLPFKHAINSNGRMSDICGKYANMTITKAREAILNDLDFNSLISRQDSISHNVSVHERCGKPVEILLTKQWFIEVLSGRDKFLELGDKINWYPSSMKNRYINWVKNLQWDWCISRQRYFGVPFPVWYCKHCGQPMVADESQLPVNPLTDKPLHNCECGCQDFIGESDVMDTWATSSMTPFINLVGNGASLDSKLLPMSLRPNAHDIIRTWDFYTIVKSFYHTGKLPWNNVMISGFVMANKNEKISKRKSNSKIDPQRLISDYSSDVVRYWAATASLGSDVVYSEEKFKNGRKLVNKIWNASKFFISHLEDFVPQDNIKLLPIDEWIMFKFNSMYKKFDEYLSDYEVGLAFIELEKFFWNFCDEYIEIVKLRLYRPDIYGAGARKSAQYAGYRVLLGILKCFAIYFPHITEEIYQNYFKQHEKKISIHLMPLKCIDFNFTDTSNLLRHGEMLINIISATRKYKSSKKLSLKTELDSLKIKGQNLEFIKKSENDIKAACVCNEISYEHNDLFSVIVNNDMTFVLAN